nr:amidase family protein [Klebsiella pneumoniae]
MARRATRTICRGSPAVLPAVRPRRVAAGLVHFSLGSDTNGSIRVPASLCGIFGLKPTFGRLSRSGSHPFVASLDHIGPFARRVADLAAVYDALQGRDPADDFQADKASERTGNLLDRELEGLTHSLRLASSRQTSACCGRWARPTR